MTCVFPQLSSELRKQSAAWVLCAGDSRIAVRMIFAVEQNTCSSSHRLHRAAPANTSHRRRDINLHRDAFVLQTISLSLKLSLYDWQMFTKVMITSSLHRCTVKTEGATAFQSITAWTLHHCQRDLWENWKRRVAFEWQVEGKERKGKERKGKERKGKERKGKERKGKERKGKKGKERKGKERKGKEILTTIFIIFYLHSIFLEFWTFIQQCIKSF